MMQSDLDDLEKLIGAAVTVCIARMNEDDDPIQQMNELIAVIEMAHAKCVGTTVLSMLEAYKKHGDVGVKPGALLKFVEASESDFSDNLRSNLSRLIKEKGLYDIFDPNAKLRDEILAESND